MGHARVLSKLEDKYQIKELTDKIMTEGLSVRELEDLTSSKETFIRRNKVSKPKIENPEFNYIEENLIEKLGTKVRVKNNKIEITFSNINDLNRLLEIMNLDK